MIKTTYYIGTNDKDTLKQELCKSDFIKLFDALFKNYTLQEAYGRFTNKENKITEELSFIVTAINSIDDIDMDIIETNCNVLKNKLNQETILVEITYPDAYFI